MRVEEIEENRTTKISETSCRTRADSAMGRKKGRSEIVRLGGWEESFLVAAGFGSMQILRTSQRGRDQFSKSPIISRAHKGGL